ncbi:MAG: polyhydroxyalkanoic acid system family protein [Planctomycetota bacterium]
MEPKTVDLKVPHQLGRDEAKRRLERGFGKVAGVADGLGQIEQTWTGDEMTFRVAAMGQTVDGKATVHGDHVAVVVQLPWLLAKMAEVLRPKIEATTHEALRLPAE